MNFLGLVWIASYVGSLFSPQSLLKTSDHLVKVFAAKTLSVFGEAATVTPSSRTTGVSSASTNHSESQVARSVSTPTLGWQSSRTQIPLVQSFLHPFSWLNPTDSILFRPNPERSPLIGEPKTQFRFGPPVASPIGTLDRARQRQTGKGSPKYVLKLLSSLSDWTQAVGKQLKNMTTNVVVIKADQVRSGNAVNPSVQPSQVAKQVINQAQCNPRRSQWAAQSATSRKSGFQVWVKGHLVAELPSKAQADAIAQRIRKVLQRPKFDPFTLVPALVDNVPTGKAGNETLFIIDGKLERALGRNGTMVAIDWINNLRMALSTPVLTLTQAQAKLYGLKQTGEVLEGIASWYGPYFHGRLTAAGETFNQNELTAAHPSLPFDTYLKVTNLRTGNEVIVRINDRGPYVGSRSLDLSRQAARCLGSERTGVVPYEAVIMEPVPPVITAENLEDSQQRQVTQVAQRP
jgi:rare lipoprotein A